MYTPTDSFLGVVTGLLYPNNLITTLAGASLYFNAYMK